MRRLPTLLLAVAAVTSACAIRPDSSPNDIAAERSAVFGEPATGDEAAGTNRIFLLSPTTVDEPQNLRSVLRDVSPNASAILGSLFAGPNADERADTLDTAIPSDIELLSARTVGQVLTIDLNDVFDDLNTSGLRLAIAQIIATATEIEGISSVQVRIEGERRVWPLGNGELTERPLTIYDYPGLVESSQPPFPAIPTAIPTTIPTTTPTGTP